MNADHLSAPADIAETDGLHAWSRPRRGRLRLGALVAVAAAVAAAIPVWAPDGVQRTICERVLARTPVAQAVALAPCAPRYRPVGETDAQTAVDRFFGGLSGADPAAGWRTLAPSFRAGESRREWLAQWRSSVWADTSAPVKAAGYNTYTVDVRDYRPDGSRTRRWRLRIGHTRDGGLQILDVGVVERLAAPPRRIRRLVYRTPSDLWQRPRSDTAVTLPARAHELRTGGTLRAMCQIHHPGRIGRPLTDPDWWTRTSLGWIPNEALDTEGRDTRQPGLAACDPHWAVR